MHPAMNIKMGPMLRKPIHAILIALLLALLAALHAAEFHVAPSGYDANPGMKGKPLPAFHGRTQHVSRDGHGTRADEACRPTDSVLRGHICYGETAGLDRSDQPGEGEGTDGHDRPRHRAAPTRRPEHLPRTDASSAAPRHASSALASAGKTEDREALTQPF